MQLTDEEREHIRLSEEYRAEVRAKLAAPTHEDPWYAQLTFPLMMLIATALVSGLLVPWILDRVADEKRAFELQSKLIEQIVSDDAAAQVNLYQYRGRFADFKMTLLKIELEKQLNSKRSLPDEELKVRREELKEHVIREHDRYNVAYTAMVASREKYFIEQRNNIEWVRLHYGKQAPLEDYVNASRRDSDVALSGLRPYHEELNRIYDKTAADLRKCETQEDCQLLFDQVDVRVQKLRDRQPDFQAWEEARIKLVQFISTTRPRI